MPRFVLIDHSLKGVGGHHYEYAVQVLAAAERAGYEPVLAANRVFAGREGVPAHWRVLTPYRFSTYTRTALVRDLCGRFPPVGVGAAVAPAAPGRRTLWRALPQRWREQLQEAGRRLRGHRRRVDFVRGTRAVFREVGLVAGDHVFVPTLSDLDVEALARFLASDARTRAVAWHLQFHDNIEPDWQVDPDRLAAFRRRLRRSLDAPVHRAPGHRLHYFATTEALAEQYGRLRGAPVRALPFPVCSPLCPPAGERPDRETLRVVLLGGGRAEKGLQRLGPIVDALWPDHLATGRLQLVVQARSTSKLPESVTARLGGGAARGAAPNWQSPICLVPYPLDTKLYRDLVAASDIGLLLYDRWRYQDRFSGVLAELLAAGVPVIVPAGTWMADQIAEETCRYQEGLRDRLLRVGDVRAASAAHDGAAATLELELPARTTHLLLRFRWSSPQARCRYVRLEAAALGDTARATRISVHVLGRRTREGDATALIALDRPARGIRLRWASAYDGAAIAVARVEAELLSAEREPQRRCPRSAVGLLATDAREVPALLREMIEHHAHYRATARAFAPHWVAHHAPERTVSELLRTRSRTEADAAAPGSLRLATAGVSSLDVGTASA